MNFRRRFSIPTSRLTEGIVCEDSPAAERLVGQSLKWLCCYCGREYAELRCFKSGKLSPFTFRNGCCTDCEGHRYHVPGSLDQIDFPDRGYPPAVISYELSAELAFLDHEDHPHNKVYQP